MINVGMYYNVKKGHEKEFEDTFQKVVEYLKNNINGFEKAGIYKKVGEENSATEYMIYSEWKDTNSFREFTTAKAFHETTEYGKGIIEGRPYHKIFNQVKEEN